MIFSIVPLYKFPSQEKLALCELIIMELRMERTLFVRCFLLVFFVCIWLLWSFCIVFYSRRFWNGENNILSVSIHWPFQEESSLRFSFLWSGKTVWKVRLISYSLFPWRYHDFLVSFGEDWPLNNFHKMSK